MTAKSGGRPNGETSDDMPAPEAVAEAAQRVAKGAAQEVIGKLVGDDAEVTKGRAEQRAAGRDLGEDAKR